MAPECFEAGTIGAGADVWSLGCVLYELLTGTRPFDGRNPSEVISHILLGNVPPLDELVPAPAARISAKVRFKDDGPEYRFDFTFQTYTTEPIAPSAATRTAVFSSKLYTNPQRSAQRSLTIMLKGLPDHG